MPYGASQPIRGITTGANAAAGNVGERIPDQVLLANAIAIASGIPLTIVGPLAVNPGDYDIFGALDFHGATSATTVFAGAISTVTNTLPGFDALGQFQMLTGAAINYSSYQHYPLYKPLNTAVAVNLFLVGAAIFGGPGGVTISGWLSVRRSANAG